MIAEDKIEDTAYENKIKQLEGQMKKVMIGAGIISTSAIAVAITICRSYQK